MKSQRMRIRHLIRNGLFLIFSGLLLSASRAAVIIPQNFDLQRETLRFRGFETSFLPKLDPAKGEMVFVGQQIFDGLVRLDDSLNVIPDLAEYWYISEGGRTYTFNLRKGVRFHNGRFLTAEDVKFSLERLLRKESLSPYSQFFVDKVVGAEDFVQGKAAGVSGFRILDPSIFEVEWKYPYVSALSLLSMSFCRILPKDLVEKQGQDFFFHPIGTGPFVFDVWMRSPRLDIVGVRLIRNSFYHGRKPLLAAVEYSPHFTSDNFAERVLDIMPYSVNQARLGCQVVEGGALNVSYLSMSCANAPFDRPRVRRAMALVVDREKIVEALASDSLSLRVSHNYIPAKLPGFFPSINPENPNPERARQILEEEGYFQAKEFPEILLFIPVSVKMTHAPFVRELTRQFEAMGVSLNTKNYRSLTELKDVRQPFFVFLAWGMNYPDPENVIQPLFAGSSALNRMIMKYQNPDFERLLEAAGFEAGWTKRLDFFREIERILRRDVPAIPLFSFEQRMAVQPFIRGLRIPALGALYIDLREVAFSR